MMYIVIWFIRMYMKLVHKNDIFDMIEISTNRIDSSQMNMKLIFCKVIYIALILLIAID